MSLAQTASNFAHKQVQKGKQRYRRADQRQRLATESLEGEHEVSTSFLGKEVAGQVSLSRLQAYVIAFVTIGVAGTVGLDIMGSVKSNINNTNAEQGATNAIDGMNELLGFLPVIGLVVAAAVVIGLVSGFGRGGGTRGRA
jgi:hypothetical protein